MLTRCCSTLLSCNLATVGEVKLDAEAATAAAIEAATDIDRFCLYVDMGVDNIDELRLEEEEDEDDDDEFEEQ